ncbi:hypothetical protein Syun_012248 [Stephania yunnanensis]|uniref:beta-galactosidase n=1 Tax=Stephania yunnanensis TaxID=152371 RepID=A0AAP0K0H4_9MAGN
MVGSFISKVGIMLMNMESSRSHCAYIFTVQQESVRDTSWKGDSYGLVWIEKIEKTGAEGKILEKAKTIIKSLSAPGNSFSRFDWDSARCSCSQRDRRREIINAQIQNEYGNVNSAYGAAVKPYIKWPASMATSLDTGVPWVMCQQSDAPDPIHTASDSPAGKSTYSLIREPGELVKIKYTDVPLLYYTEILSMPDGLATEFKNSVAIPSLIFQEYMHESQMESETEIRIPSLISLLIRNGIRDGIRNGNIISVSDSVFDSISD